MLWSTISPLSKQPDIISTMNPTLSHRCCLLVALVSIAVTKLPALPTSSVDSYSEERVSVEVDIDPKCTTCVKENQQQFLTDEEELQLRIELFKIDLLRKMNIKEPPNVSKLPHTFPKIPLKKIMKTSDRDYNTIDEQHKTESKKVDKATILADKISSDLTFGEKSTSVTFKIKTTTLRSYIEIVQAHLWILLKPEALPRDTNIRVFTDIGGSIYYADVLDASGSDEWLSVDLTNLMRRWVIQLNDTLDNVTGAIEYTIHIDVPTVAVGYLKDERPILIISGSQVVRKRVARNTVTCSGDARERCCVQSLSVTFNEIGWGDWIVQPDSFTVNYCKGHCDDSNDALYNNTLALIGYTRHTNSLLVSRCCVPSVLRPLNVIYLSDVTDSSGSPVVSQMTMDDMIIDECGCM